MLGVGAWESAVAAAQGADKKKKSGGFQSMGLEKPLLDAILKKGFVVPTPIQRKAIPILLQGSDVVAMARTGSGKTAAFLIPMLQKLKAHSKIVGARGVVLSPTRELALQILRDGFTFNKLLDLRFAALVGGSSMDQQFELMASNPDILIATPGRLLHIIEEASIQLSAVRMLVLDEADRLFEMGLQPQIVTLVQKIPDTAQRALFSATMPTVLAEFTNAGLHNPVVIRLDAEVKLSDKLKQSAFLVRNDEKVAALVCILKRIIHVGEAVSQNAQALVFVESRFHVEYVQMILDQYMISCGAVHGQMDQEARRIAVQNFTRRKTCVLVVTDVAARGLDIPLLDNVVNFSFPFGAKLFIHRVGRVARAGRSGSAYSIMTFEDFPYYVDLMQFLDSPLQCRRVEGDLLFRADDRCYGRLPEEDIQLELDFLKRVHESDVELRNMAKVVENAHRKFNRTKRKPTHEAIQIARRPEYAFDNTPLHPMLLERMDARRVAADVARFDLKRFKVKDSLLELQTGVKMFALTRPETVQSLAEQERMDQMNKQQAAQLAGRKTTRAGELLLYSATDTDASATATTKNGATSDRTIEASSMSSSSNVGGGNADGSTTTTHPHGASTPPASSRRGASDDACPADEPAMSLAEKLMRRAQSRRMSQSGLTGGEGSPLSTNSRLLGSSQRTRTQKENEPFDVLTLAEGRGGERSDDLFHHTHGGRFRDEEFFIDGTRQRQQLLSDSTHYSVKDATLDINAETAQEAAQQRQVYAWSKKKNRYVKMHVNDAKALLKGMKNEAGKMISHKTKLQEYLKWTRKSNLRIQDVGEEEDLAPLQRLRAAGKLTEGDEDNNDDDIVDISDPNQGKKLRVGRKQKKLPKDGRLRSFEELASTKRKALKEKTRLAKKQQHQKKSRK